MQYSYETSGVTFLFLSKEKLKKIENSKQTIIVVLKIYRVAQ